MDLNKLQAVVIDLETTGLHKRTDKIIEIGALKISGGEVTDTFSRLVNPGFFLAEETVKITHISDDMLSGRETFSQIADDLEAFLGDDILIGHSVTGDYAFLKKAFVDLRPKGYVFDKKGIDTLKLARRFLPAQEKKTLSDACRHYGLSFTAHRALEDAKATFFLLQKLYGEFGEKEPEAFEPQALRFAVKRDTPIMEKQKEMLRKLSAGMDLQLDESLLGSLSKSQASRIIDKLRARDTKLFIKLLSPSAKEQP